MALQVHYRQLPKGAPHRLVGVGEDDPVLQAEARHGGLKLLHGPLELLDAFRRKQSIPGECVL